MDKIFWLDEEPTGTIIEGKISDAKIDINKIALPLILKSRVLFSPGTHNGIHYKASELASACSFSSLPLFLDHNEKFQTQVGLVRNPTFKDDRCLGDLVIFDLPTAQKILSFAKVGISPRITFLDEKGTAKSPRFDSFSLVITPADEKTILNSSNPNSSINPIKMDNLPENQKDTNSKANNDLETAENICLTKAEIKKLLKIDDIDELKNKLAQLIGLDFYPYPNEMLKKQVCELQTELDKVKKASAEKLLTDEIKSTALLESELFSEPLTQCEDNFAKLNKSIDFYQGVKYAYNKISDLLNLATNLDERSSMQNSPIEQTPPIPPAEVQMLDLCTSALFHAKLPNRTNTAHTPAEAQMLDLCTSANKISTSAK